MAIGNVRLLAQQLEAEGIRVPTRTATTGRTTGGVKFSRGQIYRILSNPTYIGEIHHHGQVYQGRNEAIVDLKLWQRVQARLADNSQGPQRAATCRSTSILAGLIVDDEGQPLVASHACKGKVRYRYYISRPLQHAGDGNQTGVRMAAPELEKAVTAAIADLFADPLGLAHTIGLKPTPQQMTQLAHDCERTVQNLQQREAETFRELISEIEIGSQTIRLSLNAGAIWRDAVFPCSQVHPEPLRSGSTHNLSGRAR